MLKKLCYLVPLVLIMLMGTTGASGDELHWTGTANPDPNWHNPNNWDTGAVPAPGDDAYAYHVVGKADPNFSSKSSTDPVCLLCLAKGAASSTGIFNIDSGTINVVGAVRASKSSSGTQTSTVNMKGGTIICRGTQNGVQISWGSCNGDVVTDGALSWGPNAGTENTNGTFNMSGGLIDAGTVSIGGLSTSSTTVFNLKGGTVRARQLSYGYGNPNAKAGLYIGDASSTGNLRHGGMHNKMNIEAGKLIANGDLTTLIASYVDPCQVLIPYPNDSGTTYHKYIVCDYDDRTDSFTTVTAAKTLLAKAWKPNPIDAAGYASQTPTLIWNVGHSGVKDCNTHDVYVGTSLASVTSASGGIAPPGGQYSQVSIVASSASFAPSMSFGLGKTYYWRVDELYPAITTGDVWSFRVTGAPKRPSPADGFPSVDTEPNTNVAISWADSLTPTTHNLYISTDSANMGSPISKSGTSHILAAAANAKYYWRVDEIFSGPVTVTGDTWSFTTNVYRRSDDFERYSGSIPTTSWFNDYYGGSGTSSPTYSLTSTLPTATDRVAHFGQQALRFDYIVNTNGSPNAFQAMYKINAGGNQDWSATGANAKALTMYIRGKATNKNPGTVAVQLENAAHTQGPWVALSDVGTMLTSELWTEVNIDLSQLAGGGLSLNAVAYISIKVEDSIGGGTAKTGTLYIDDIRLYPSRCVSDYAGSASNRKEQGLVDLSNDCVINYSDIGLMSNYWLQGDANVMSDAVLHGGTRVTGKHGFGVQLDGVKDWIDIDDLAVGPLTSKTIMFWFMVNSEPTPYASSLQTGASAFLFGTSNEWRANIILMAPSGSGLPMVVNSRIGPSGVNPPSFGTKTVGTGSWHHAALSFDNGASDTQNARLYLDGAMNGNGNSASPAHYYPYTSGICIGALNNGFSGFGGITVDDFRIYNRQLTDTEVAKVAIQDVYPTIITPNDSNTPLIRYDFDDATFGTSSAQLGSKGKCYHPTGYVQYTINPLTVKYNYVYPNTVSPGELWGKEAPATTVTPNRYVNWKDYALIAKHWTDVLPNWP